MCPSSAARFGVRWNATLSAYAKLNSTCQTIHKFPLGLLGTNFICKIISLRQYDYKNTILNPKILYKSKTQYNYNNKNYIPELLWAYSVVVDGKFLQEWCGYFSQPQVWCIRYVPQSVNSTASAFDLNVIPQQWSCIKLQSSMHVISEILPVCFFLSDLIIICLYL